ncbi:RsbR, positive regulator of sigma-B [Labilithrix luteola]|uniref:RsbR, positive regulator of sigma-B n=1 Tax=Labilithrix luteola TaxID=1391654 RepID=A0A0K1PIU7_9BACT|nr:STAS domain-containing protein [Labilithrix luteola]AKU93445.1 RsbR, positive regulator of sigma-B [Labilithrix luteola]
MIPNVDSLLVRFFETAATPLALLDRRGVFVRANAAWKSFVSGAVEEGKSLVDLVAVSDAPRVKAFFEQLSGEARLDVRLAAPNAGAEERLLRFHATLDAPSNVIQLVGMDGFASLADANAASLLQERASVVDRSEIMLKAFNAIVDTVPVVLWSTDEKGTFLAHQGMGLRQLGMTPGAAVGQNLFDLFKDYTPVLEAAKRGFQGESSRMVDEFPGDIHFDSWILPMKADDDSVHGVVGLAIDATARVRKERELAEKLDLIQRQTATIRALATPIIQIWDQVLCVPIIGTVDSQRTSEMMDSLLAAIAARQAQYAIVDLTGVEVIDTMTADHLIKLFRAAQLLGTEGVLCGMRPAVAQTVVALGVDLTAVRTMRSLREALLWCIREQHERSESGTSTARN